ncbi:metal-sulfur cluster assembly factor [Paenibacillus larvae]|uniref:metal-sulfur cluster assembly factor n=1 Tax=Paenibacillus larvae TaxID=1464 RepID=UPI002853E056|nr:metal-sulfur cluster assembly factor [Paenibacillus larvae]MDR5583652.1 metal-sulfur cluster assembly factor [Paenibacillus larvae]
MEDSRTALLMEKLEEVVDPDLQIDIVNLGLIYSIDFPDEDYCHIRMTMTSMGCPHTGTIVAEVKYLAEQTFPELNEVQVELVWSSPWTKDRLSSLARYALGVHM